MNESCLSVQVKYREEYERNKGRSQMEFGDTQTYKVSKEAQKMQSEVKVSLLQRHSDANS